MFCLSFKPRRRSIRQSRREGRPPNVRRLKRVLQIDRERREALPAPGKVIRRRSHHAVPALQQGEQVASPPNCDGPKGNLLVSPNAEAVWLCWRRRSSGLPSRQQDIASVASRCKWRRKQAVGEPFCPSLDEPAVTARQRMQAPPLCQGICPGAPRGSMLLAGLALRLVTSKACRGSQQHSL